MKDWRAMKKIQKELENGLQDSFDFFPVTIGGAAIAGLSKGTIDKNGTQVGVGITDLMAVS